MVHQYWKKDMDVKFLYTVTWNKHSWSVTITDCHYTCTGKVTDEWVQIFKKKCVRSPQYSGVKVTKKFTIRFYCSIIQTDAKNKTFNWTKVKYHKIIFLMCKSILDLHVYVII